MLEKLQEMVNGYGFGITVEGLVSNLYWALEAEGADVYIVNDRYLGVGDTTYQLRKTRSKGHWTVIVIC